MQEVAQSNKAAQATAAIKAAYKEVSDLCNTWEINVSSFLGKPKYVVLVVSKRDLDQIPAPLEVFPVIDIARPWTYRKIYNGIEFYCRDVAGEE